MSEGRQRLKPWLESKIESGQINGLYWINREKKIFQIPWKRNGTTGWVRDGSALFRDYAIHTGKFREGIDKEDYPVWKTRLRCALNKHPEIILLQDRNIDDENNPYRVYQMIDRLQHDEFLPIQGNEVEMVEDLRPSTSPIDSSPSNNPTHFNIPQGKELIVSNDMLLGSMDSDLKKISYSDLIKCTSDEFRQIQQFEPQENSFEVIIRFRSKELAKYQVKKWCLLTTNSNIQIQNDCQVILFPDIIPETQEVQNIITTLWQNLVDGLYIGFDEKFNIIAQRHCKCRIYYRSQHDQSCFKLDRTVWTNIFDYQEFSQNLNKPDLQTGVTLYIGQKGEVNPYNFTNVFLSVTINHLDAVKCLNIENMKRHHVSLSVGSNS